MTSARERFFASLFEKNSLRKRYPHYDSALHAYLRDIQHIALLSPTEERALLLQAQSRDESALERIVVANLRLVVVIAVRFQGRGLSMIDLIQEGNLGLLEGVKRFDFSKSSRLSTYAKFRILHQIGRALAEHATLIHTPYSTGQKMAQIEHVVSEFVQHGIEPSTKQIAERTGQTIDQVVELLVWMQEPLSLNFHAGEDDPLEDMLEAPPLILSQEPLPSPSLFSDVLQVMERALSDIELRVLKLRFGLEDGISYGHHDIAEKVFHRHGVRADVRIRQIEQSALKKIRAVWEENALDSD